MKALPVLTKRFQLRTKEFFLHCTTRRFLNFIRLHVVISVLHNREAEETPSFIKLLKVAALKCVDRSKMTAFHESSMVEENMAQQQSSYFALKSLFICLQG
jgi:hypothetical protein